LIKYAANLTLMFQEWAFLDRFEAARDAGFKAVEFAHPSGVTAERIAEQLRRTELHQVLATMPVPPGTKGLAAVIGQQAKFRDDFRVGLDYAALTQCPLLHVLSGVVGQSELAASAGQFICNMEWAIEQAAQKNIRVVIEAINQISIPDYFVRSLSNAFHWATSLPELGVILDLYHARMEGLDPVECVRSYASGCDHIQIAGYPGRHEPDRGTLELGSILSAVQDSGFSRWIGCEYQPETSTLDGLGWMHRCRLFD